MPKEKTPLLGQSPDLIEQLKTGDKSAFEKFFYIYYPALLQFARRELKSNELADDVVQDVFVSLWVKRQQIMPGNSMKGYLFTILKNKILNAVRTQKNIILKHSKFVENKDMGAAPADSRLIFAEQSGALGKMFSKFPKAKQRILILSMHGYDNKDISRKVKLSKNTVKMYLSESKKRLKSMINNHS